LIGIAAGQRLIAGVDAAFTALDRAEPLAREGHLTRELAEIHYLRGNLHFVRSAVDECRAQHAMALDYARSLGNPEWEARALSGLADADYASGRMRSALERFTRCVELCEANGLPRIAVPNRVMVGLCRGFLTDFDGGFADMLAARAAAAQLGDRHAEMLALESMGILGTLCGRHAAAEQWIRRGMELAESIGARRYEATLLGGLAECALAAGRRAEARELADRAVAVARETGMAFGGPWALGIRLRTLEDPREREQCIREAETLFRRAHDEPQPPLASPPRDRGTRWPDGIGRRRCDMPPLWRNTRAEPLPYCDFLIARARTLAALAERPGDAALRAELVRLRAEADRVAWPIGWPGWSEAA
jgi:tetratricopeptide (TPR) repeat protein